MHLILVFLVKVLDNVLATSKTILVQKNKPFLAAVSVSLSQLIFFKLVSQVISSSSEATLYMVALASGCGTFLAIHLSSRFSRDRTFTHVLMSDDIETIFNARDYFMEKKIDNLIVPTISKEKQDAYSLLVFAHTKHESILVEELLATANIKIKRVLQKN